MKKVELLSPAGSVKALEGAIHAGADAVYLGGEQYGARAYADNFSGQEIIWGIHFAHVFGRKIYLTVNTLVKEKELDALYGFLLPLYENGLDGVIVQDLGVLGFIRAYFPGLLLHASTQMSVTGWRGVEFLQREGVSRIVPARELSLEEMIGIKQRTGIEIEAFIHGAMCYCYSGQCLFSSILGGRSGNRGRCAQPCRLPYKMDGRKESYLLSMRDMCTLEILPELIGAGIDSFKIEGRMKRPEYAAGVTAIYRKYIDRYYECLEMGHSGSGLGHVPDKGNYQIDRADRERLHALYIRSQTGEGYYHRQNGKEMLTLGSPAYTETDEEILTSIRETYIDRKFSVPVKASITLEAGKEAQLKLENDSGAVTVTGGMAQAALKQPLSEEKIIAQIRKDGQSLLAIHSVQVQRTGEVFLPVGALNQLRREASAAMEQLMIQQNGLAYGERKAAPYGASPKPEGKPVKRSALHASVRTTKQLLAAIDQRIERIYLDYGLLAGADAGKIREILGRAGDQGISFYAAAPYIVRRANEGCLDLIREAVADGTLSGVLVRNLESFGYFERCLSPGQIVLDANLYLWNRESIRFWKGKVSEYYLPLECNGREWKSLSAYHCDPFPVQSAIVYGRIPMMVTANCVQKTVDGCRKNSGVLMLEDRYGKLFPVFHDCMSCYNIIYNSVPLSLHGLFKDRGNPPFGCRMDFTTESGREAGSVMGYFKQLVAGEYKEPSDIQYTTGHYKRGVE